MRKTSGMTKIIIFLLCFTLWMPVFHAFGGPITTVSTTKFSYQISKKSNPSLPVFKFVLSGIYDGMDYNAKNIKITKNNGTKLVQSILIKEARYFEKNNIKLEDMNFDGYLDFRLVQFSTAGPNTPYHYYIWNIKQAKFVYNPTMSELLTSATFDKKSKTITTSNKDGPGTFYTEKFRFQNGKLVKFYYEVENLVDECQIIRNLQNGKWNEVKNTCNYVE
jgi:hypothetical protein